MSSQFLHSPAVVIKGIGVCAVRQQGNGAVLGDYGSGAEARSAVIGPQGHIARQAQPQISAVTHITGNVEYPVFLHFCRTGSERHTVMARAAPRAFARTAARNGLGGNDHRNGLVGHGIMGVTHIDFKGFCYTFSDIIIQHIGVLAVGLNNQCAVLALVALHHVAVLIHKEELERTGSSVVHVSGIRRNIARGGIKYGGGIGNAFTYDSV